MAQVAVVERDDITDSPMARDRIPRRFWSATLARFRRHTPSQAAALDAVQHWRDNGGMLALIGATGTGKSHLLYAVARERFEARRGGFVRPWYALVDQLRWGMVVNTESGGRTREASEVRTDWWEADTVLLDEVRATSGSDFDGVELAKYSCHAYDQMRNVLITTNTPLEELMGGPAASRYTQVVIDGPDGRAA